MGRSCTPGGIDGRQFSSIRGPACCPGTPTMRRIASGMLAYRAGEHGQRLGRQGAADQALHRREERLPAGTVGRRHRPALARAGAGMPASAGFRAPLATTAPVPPALSGRPIGRPRTRRSGGDHGARADNSVAIHRPSELRHDKRDDYRA